MAMKATDASIRLAAGYRTQLHHAFGARFRDVDRPVAPNRSFSNSVAAHAGRYARIAAIMAVILTLVLVLMSLAPADAQNWPQFRGARAGVAADDARLPETWSTTDNVAWKIDVLGRSWSSPVVWGNHVFVVTAINNRQPAPTLNAVGTYLARSLGGPMTGNDVSQPIDEHRWVLYDVDFRTGKIAWSQTIAAAVPQQPVHQKNSYASETPVTDGERVYVYLGYAGLFAFDMNGKPVWANPMTAPKMRTGWGPAASPVLHNGRLFIVNDNEERSFIAAFDARTGKQLWRTDRETEGSNWSTPFVWQNEVRTEIVTTGSKGVRSYDVDGRLLWQLTGMTSIHAVTPLASHGLLFVSSGYFPDAKRPTYAIKPGAGGDISLKGDERSNAFIAWSHPTLAPAYPSPLVVGDQYYTLMDRGFVTSNDPKTGEEIYGRRRIAVDAGTFTASPWSYNGKIFALSEDGDTFVMQAGKEFKLIRRNSLGEMTLASPAIADGSVIIRTATKLYRIARATR
jgi:outer membrane protein assembly factor BamB